MDDTRSIVKDRNEVDQGTIPIKPKHWGAPPRQPQGSGRPPNSLAGRPELSCELRLESRGQHPVDPDPTAQPS